MRVVGFRGRVVGSGKWLYGSLVKGAGPTREHSRWYILPHGQNEIIVNEDFLIKTTTIGQNTGRRDIEDTPIYEGDLVHASCEKSGRSYLGEVEFSEEMCGFVIAGAVSIPLGNFPNRDIVLQIVGNIHAGSFYAKQKYEQGTLPFSNEGGA